VNRAERLHKTVVRQNVDLVWARPAAAVGSRRPLVNMHELAGCGCGVAAVCQSTTGHMHANAVRFCTLIGESCAHVRSCDQQ